MNEFLSANYWEERYQQKATGWDIGKVSTPLKAYIDQLDDKNSAILIPGAGNAYEAIYLLEKGFTNITVVDLAPLVTQQLAQRIEPAYQPYIHIITGDFFQLSGSFDLILEQTFFCAIDPSLRKAYAQKMQTLLSGNGKLVGLLFNRSFNDGPPFGGNILEYRQLFEPFFSIYTMESCYNSIAPRAGHELFIRLALKAMND